MQHFLVLALLLLTGYSALANNETNNRANVYLDNFLSTAFFSEVRSLELDPAPVSDVEIEFEEHIKVFGKVRGRVEFEGGTLEGLSEARRQSDCRGRLLNGNRTRIVDCTVRFELLKVRHEGKLKYGRVPKITVKGKGKVKDAEFFLEIVQEHPMQPILRNFTCTQAGDLEVKFKGLGPFNRFMSILEDGYARHVRTVISEAMGQLQYAVNRALSKDLLLF